MKTIVSETFFPVPKMCFSQEKCTQITGMKIFSSMSVDGLNSSLPRRHFTEVESSQAKNTKFIFSQAIHTLFISSYAIDSKFISSYAIDSKFISSHAVDRKVISSQTVDSTLISSHAVGRKVISSQTVDSTRISSQAIDSTRISSQAIDTKFIFSKPVDRLAFEIEYSSHQNEAIHAKTFRTSENFNHAVFNKKSSDCLGFNIAKSLHQKETLQNSGSEFQSSRLAIEISPRIGKPNVLQKTCHFKKHVNIEKHSEVQIKSEATTKQYKFLHQMRYAKENSGNFLISCGLNADEQIEDTLIANENHFNGQSGNSGKYIVTSKSEQRKFYLGNQLSLSGTDKTSRSSSKHFLTKEIEKTANELLIKEYGNRYSYFENDSLQSDISPKYRQLYSETHQNYDFAMKLMAYTEFLNDISWSETHSYFNENVKKMVENIWFGVKYYVNNRNAFSVMGIDTFQQLLFELAKSLDQTETFNLKNFLVYCVMMCQIGVRARKRELREAPVYVIFHLRNRIEEIENSRHNYFEFIVEYCAEKLAQSFKL